MTSEKKQPLEFQGSMSSFPLQLEKRGVLPILFCGGERDSPQELLQ